MPNDIVAMCRCQPPRGTDFDQCLLLGLAPDFRTTEDRRAAGAESTPSGNCNRAFALKDQATGSGHGDKVGPPEQVDIKGPGG